MPTEPETKVAVEPDTKAAVEPETKIAAEPKLKPPKTKVAVEPVPKEVVEAKLRCHEESSLNRAVKLCRMEVSHAVVKSTADKERLCRAYDQVLSIRNGSQHRIRRIRAPQT